MENCFTRKIKATINDSSLKKLGWFKVTVKYDASYTPAYLGIVFNIPIEAYIDGNGYFLKASDSSNVGKHVYDWKDYQYFLSAPAQGEEYDVYFHGQYYIQMYSQGSPIFLESGAFDSAVALQMVSIQNASNTGNQKIPKSNVLTMLNNYAQNTSIDLTYATHIAILNGYFDIPQATLNNIAPNLTECSFNKKQPYVIDLSIFNNSSLNSVYGPSDPDNIYQEAAWLQTKTGKIIDVISFNLGSYVDTMLLNMANLTANGSRLIVVTGTSDYQTDTSVQTALTTLRSKGCEVRLNGTVIN